MSWFSCFGEGRTDSLFQNYSQTSQLWTHLFFILFFCLVWRRVNAGGFELVGGWGTCCSFSRYTTVSLLLSFLLSPPSHLPPIFHPTLVHFLLFSLLCLDEWFSKGKIFPMNFEKRRLVLYLVLLTQNNKITREIRDFHVMSCTEAWTTLHVHSACFSGCMFTIHTRINSPYRKLVSNRCFYHCILFLFKLNPASWLSRFAP